MHSLNFNIILDLVKKSRQNLIYAVSAIVLGILVYNGLYLLIPITGFFYLRFKKNSWIFYLIFILSIFVIHHKAQVPDLPVLPGDLDYHTAEIKRIRRRSGDRQTAIVEIDGKPVFMTYRDGYPRLLPGQTVEIFGRITTPTKPTIPYRFDFGNFLANQNIHHTVHTSRLTVTADGFSIWTLQYYFSEWISSRFPHLTSSYLQSFFLGVRDDLDEEMMAVFGNLGILQIFSISGVNITLLTGILKDFLKRIGLIDLIVEGFVILFCIAFIFIAGGSVSVVRACLMAIFSIINKRLKFGFSSFDIFSIVFIGNFLLNPLVVFQGGFQFSYWISFVLLCSRTSLKGLSSLKSKFVIVYLARMAAIPLSISSGFDVNVTSYIANLLISPVLMSVIIPSLLITLFLPFLAPLMDILLHAFEFISTSLEPVLNINIIFGYASLLIVVCLLASLIISCYFYEIHKKAWIRFAVIAVYFIILEVNRIWNPVTTITFLDVGQGDSTVIRSPFQSCTIVIDTGGDVSRVRSENPSIFSNTLEPYLLGNGVRNVDFLILTHEHYDHYAESIPLMSRFNVRNMIVSEAAPGEAMKEILEFASNLGINIHIAKPMDSFSCGNQVYTFVHSEVDKNDTNEDSLVAVVEINGFNVLLTADIGHVTEAAVLGNIHTGHIDVYHVAHHGSRHSNSRDFMDSLNIRYAVVQAGRGNFYGHPHMELIDATDYLGIPLLNSIIHGTVQFRVRNRGYEIFIFPPSY